MNTEKDPVTGRSFDGRYDEKRPCGCIDFYHGGTILCSQHENKADQGWRRIFREGQTKF
jgi:hypothetical protein